MKHLKMNVDRAYEYVKKCRPEISPNLGFMGQLLEYQKKLEGDKKSEDIENEEEKDSQLQSTVSQKIIAPQVHVSLPASSGKYIYYSFYRIYCMIESVTLFRKQKRSIWFGPSTKIKSTKETSSSIVRI